MAAHVFAAARSSARPVRVPKLETRNVSSVGPDHTEDFRRLGKVDDGGGRAVSGVDKTDGQERDEDDQPGEQAAIHSDGDTHACVTKSTPESVRQ